MSRCSSLSSSNLPPCRRTVSRMTMALVVVAGLGVAAPARAQFLRTPQPSPAAVAQQTIGVTDITVKYSRPAVNGRQVFGHELVPYGDVWRAGANANTTVEFSTDVKVNGKPLKAGIYGFHIIPTAKEWTVIFSNVANAWGSGDYNQKDDALRVTSTPRTLSSPEERLLYRFDDLAATKATLVLAWEKVALPISIEVDTPALVMKEMRNDLRGSHGWLWQNWSSAARYWLANGGNLDEALRMADRSIDIEPTYGNLRVRAAVLDKQGKTAAANEARAKAEPMAKENDLINTAYGLLRDKKLDDAVAAFKVVVQRYPDSLGANEALGEALVAKGDKPAAVASYQKALAIAKVKDPAQTKRLEGVIARTK